MQPRRHTTCLVSPPVALRRQHMRFLTNSLVVFAPTLAMLISASPAAADIVVGGNQSTPMFMDLVGVSVTEVNGARDDDHDGNPGTPAIPDIHATTVDTGGDEVLDACQSSVVTIEPGAPPP